MVEEKEPEGEITSGIGPDDDPVEKIILVSKNKTWSLQQRARTVLFSRDLKN